MARLATWRHDLGWLAGLVLLMLILGLLAYRVPLQTRVDVGGSPGGGLFDLPYLAGFNQDPEFTPDGKVAFRWAFDDAHLRLPGAGQGVYTVSLASIGRGGDAAVSRWSLNNAPLVNVPLAQTPRRFVVIAPNHRSVLDLHLATPRFQVGSDPRPLGFAVDWVALEAVAAAGPSLRHLSLALLAIVLVYGLLRLWRLPTTVAGSLAVSGAIALAALLAWQRLALTLVVPSLVVLLITAFPLTLAVDRVLGHLSKRLTLPATPSFRPMAALVALAWLIRSVALLHPQAYTSDAGLHRNNLVDVELGKVIFTEDLPARAGGGPAPYPPGAYVTMAPATLVMSPARLIILGSALADSLVLVGIWLLAALAELPPAMALLGGALYLFALPSLRSLSVGEMANVWGQALTLPSAVALLAWQRGRVGLAAVVGCAAGALLGHFGIFLSLLAFFGIYGSLVLIRDRRSWRLAAGLAAAVAIAVGLYYAVWTDIIIHRPPAPVGTVGPLARLWQQLRPLADPGNELGLLALVLGLAGLVALRRRAPLLAGLQLGWWAAGLASLATLLISQQALRWQLWLFPALALCGGVALGLLWQRGRAGRSLASALLAVTLARGAWLWVAQIATYKHF